MRWSGVWHRSLYYLREQPGALWVMLVTINVLNLADLALTINAFALGIGEANPIMRSLFLVNPLWAGLFKFAAVLATTVWLWYGRGFRLVLEATLLILVLYLGVFFYHIAGLALLV
ncbi:MAG: hypothetical protein H5T84_04510 [Thermoleophilia bacterium]|nr:hypothetical protein [Thermoleophilia bacterium]